MGHHDEYYEELAEKATLQANNRRETAIKRLARELGTSLKNAERILKKNEAIERARK